MMPGHVEVLCNANGTPAHSMEAFDTRQNFACLQITTLVTALVHNLHSTAPCL